MAARGSDATWCPLTLAIGKAIAKGETEIAVDDYLGNLGPLQGAVRLASLQRAYPIIHLTAADNAVLEDQNRLADKYEQQARDFRHKGSSQSLHQAFQDFQIWIAGHHVEVGTCDLKPHGKRLINNTKTLINHHQDVQLGKFDLRAMEAMEDYWARRPVVDGGKIAAISTSKEQIKVIRQFFRWLHKDDRYQWRRPNDYLIRRMRIEATNDEIAARVNPEQVQRYKKVELQILWLNATPLERLIMLLGLNCGFGAAEIRSLYISEIQGDFIKRIRRKSLVYGEWQLWEVTKKAIAWYRQYRRPNRELPQLVLSRNGNPLLPSKSGNNSAAISNWWNNLIDRVQKEHPDFRRLPFNKLRKTSGNYMRRIAGGEIMAIFHARGRPVKSDEHSEVYSNRPFRRVHKAIRIMENKLAPIFAGVDDPFPAKQTKTHYTPSQIARMKRLRQQGYTMKKIGEILGCTRETVRKHLN